MQRDTYAAMLGKFGGKYVPCLVEHLTGQVTTEALCDVYLTGVKLRRLVFMTCMQSTAAFAHKAGRAVPLLPKDVIVSTWETFQRVHQPHFVYRLLPLRCASPAAFAAIQAIVTSPGSPFTLEHRQDPVPYRFSIAPHSKVRSTVMQFLSRVQRAVRQHP